MEIVVILIIFITIAAIVYFYIKSKNENSKKNNSEELIERDRVDIENIDKYWKGVNPKCEKKRKQINKKKWHK